VSPAPAPVVISPPPAAIAPAQPVVVSPQAVVVAPSTGRIVLYEFPNFGGVQAAVDRGQAKDLDWANFSNPSHRATSIRVEAGTWVVCTDIAFRGECRVLDPGDYPQLAGGLSVGVSSAQQVWRPEYGALTVYSR
jgi:Beta/Gamma crystallin